MVEAQKNVRTMQGKVLSNKMDKTVTVLVERTVKHPVVGKVIKLSNKFHAHDEKNEIAESKPMSKTKTWVVTKVLSKAPQIN
jgi:small subunit ribosomal protein S17